MCLGDIQLCYALPLMPLMPLDGPNNFAQFQPSVHLSWLQAALTSVCFNRCIYLRGRRCYGLPWSRPAHSEQDYPLRSSKHYGSRGMFVGKEEFEAFCVAGSDNDNLPCLKGRFAWASA